MVRRRWHLLQPLRVVSSQRRPVRARSFPVFRPDTIVVDEDNSRREKPLCFPAASTSILVGRPTRRACRNLFVFENTLPSLVEQKGCVEKKLSIIKYTPNRGATHTRAADAAPRRVCSRFFLKSDTRL